MRNSAFIEKGLALAILAVPEAAQAQSFPALTLPEFTDNIRACSGGSGHAPLFPGSRTSDSVSFDMVVDADSNTLAGSSIDIPVKVLGVPRAYSIIDGPRGGFGQVAGKTEFFGSNAAGSSVDLKEGANAWLDARVCDLSASFGGKTLRTGGCTSAGGEPVGKPFPAAAAVQSGPEPGARALMADGPLLLADVALRRRSRALPQGAARRFE